MEESIYFPHEAKEELNVNRDTETYFKFNIFILLSIHVLTYHESTVSDMS